MLRPGLGLDEQVCKLALRGNELGSKDALTMLIAQEEGINTDVLGERMPHRIQSDLNGTGVVAVKESRSRRAYTNVLKKPTQLDNLLSSSGHDA